MLDNLMKKLRCQKGQGAVEYALMLTVVVVVMAAFITNKNNAVATAVKDVYTKMASQIAGIP